MSNPVYDIISVGGGLGGSAIAKAMAEAGARVLVLERERQFHDRVRGEGLSPWGGAEAARLGLSDALEAAREPGTFRMWPRAAARPRGNDAAGSSEPQLLSSSDAGGGSGGGG